MLETLQKAFKIKDIRTRIFYTFIMLVVIRLGSQLPMPGVNGDVIAEWFASQGADGLNFFNAITGGSFEQMSVFALNITPYITSSIIMQASHDCNSQTGRNAKRRRRWKKENC